MSTTAIVSLIAIVAIFVGIYQQFILHRQEVRSRLQSEELCLEIQSLHSRKPEQAQSVQLGFLVDLVAACGPMFTGNGHRVVKALKTADVPQNLRLEEFAALLLSLTHQAKKKDGGKPQTQKKAEKKPEDPSKIPAKDLGI